MQGTRHLHTPTGTSCVVRRPQSRRNVLLYAGGAVAGVAGLAALLKGGGDSAFPEVDAREKASIGRVRVWADAHFTQYTSAVAAE